ncbi:peptidoglycan DD-metalloendopeptidase family protein [Mannheimia granulomatis]|uniref:peptidoglycan DD-metalloendopeptidase family protein n=1 Tax=Mannheimia granulomatis TaxID=85402 RepID=UPI0005194FFC|nr:peptidoglycan DD-metalloendopeptidase family protein [Mannheimia granulomatis]
MGGAISLSASFSFANNLNQIQQKIQQQTSKINEQKQKRTALQSTLKTQEVEMGKVLDKLQKTEMSLGEIRQTIKATELEISRLEKQERQQKEKLKEQLDSAYRSGVNPSVLERLMSEDAKNAERMTAYYEHMNNIRIDAIHEIRKTQADLKARRDELKGQQKDHQSQLNEHKKQERDLKKVQAQRESTLRSIDKTLEQDQSRLKNLRNNEAALRQQLEQAQRESEQAQKREQQAAKSKSQSNANAKVDTTPIKAGRYTMPVSGNVITKFGNNWHGVVIAAPAGTSVKAMASGRVIMAQWLAGYGQMVAIDHGNGDISLYGYNQSISVSKGSRVQGGQVIAKVGNSGGQNRSALYFGVTRKGTPINPLNLVK